MSAALWSLRAVIAGGRSYRFIYASHGQGGEGSDIAREKYYGIQNIAAAADSVIFVSASGLGGIWGLKDVPLFDDISAS